MNLLHGPVVRSIVHGCIATGVLVGLYYGSISYLNSDINRFRQVYSAGLNKQVEVDPATLACNLPEGWQAYWWGRTLWITHYNSDGSAANSLSFCSLESLYGWVETHPDFCDVNIEKTLLHVVDTTVAALDTSIPVSGSHEDE